MRSFRFRASVVVGGMIALEIVPVVVQHYRLRSAFYHWIREQAAKGEKLKISDFIPPAVPASENSFFELMNAAGRLSMLADVAAVMPPALEWVAPGKVVLLRDQAEWEVRKAGSRNRQLTHASWEVLAQELEKVSETLKDARAALAKPSCNSGLDFAAGHNLLLPHLAPLKGVAPYLQASALQALHQGDLDAALADLLALAALADTLKDEPLLISQFVRTAIVHITFTPTWQALQEPGWTDAQLLELQHAWERLEFLGGLERSLGMERAMMLQFIDRADISSQDLRAQVGGLSSSASGSGANRHPAEFLAWTLDALRWRWFWCYDDGLQALQLWQAMLARVRTCAKTASLADAQSRGPQSSRPAEGKARFALTKAGRALQNRFGSLAVVDETALTKVATVETIGELVVTAIALKRFSLKNGQYPHELASLVPDCLPRLPVDYFDGNPLRYRRNEDGSFTLWSIGEDGRDDGGDPAMPGTGPRSLNWLKGRDLVWPQPASPQQVSAHRERRSSRRTPPGGP